MYFRISIILLIVTFQYNTFCQVTLSKNYEKQFVKLFEEANYEEAAKLAGTLLSDNQDLTIAYYYLGRSLIELDREPEKAVRFLKIAASEGFNTDVHFYLGVAYFKNQQYTLSHRSFDNFCLLANKKTEKLYNVQNWYKKLNNLNSEKRGHNRYPVNKKIFEMPDTSQTDTIENTNGKKETSSNKVLDDTLQITSAVKKNDSQLSKTLESQLKIDSLNSLINIAINKKLSETNQNKRDSLVKRIIILKKEKSKYENEVSEYFKDKNPPEINEKAKNETDIDISVTSESNIKVTEKEIISPSQKPHKLVYQIQLGVYSRKLSKAELFELSPIYIEELTQKNLYKYYLGKFSSSKEVNKAITDIKQNFFPDAFIVAFYEGKKIPIQKAREIEFSITLDD